jgi:hypothetical protein
VRCKVLRALGSKLVAWSPAVVFQNHDEILAKSCVKINNTPTHVDRGLPDLDQSHWLKLEPDS